MTYRDEAQQHLVAELRKVPQYNEIYIEKEFNGFTRPYFNLHEKLDLLEGIVNKAKTINANAALPLYIDDFDNYENYKYKFQDQYLDLYILLKEGKSKFLVRSKFIEYYPKIHYAVLDSFIEDISNMFSNVEPLIEATVYTKNLKIANGLFYNCKNLKKINGNIGSKNNLIDSGASVFCFCESLKDINGLYLNIKNVSFFFYVSGIDSFSFLENQFYNSYNCYNIFDYSKIGKILNKKIFKNATEIDGAFSYCENLEEVIGNWDPTNPDNKNGFEIPKNCRSTNLFEFCKNLKLVKNLKLSNSYNSSFFTNCKSLQKIQNLQLAGICTNIFKNCPVNESWKIWLPTEIKTNEIPIYDKNNFLRTRISYDKLKTFYIDIDSVTIDGIQEPDIEKRKKQYEDLLNPNRDFTFKFINLPKPTPPEPPVTPPIVVSNDNGHCVFKNTAVYYK